MSDTDSVKSIQLTPPELKQIAQNISSDILPEKSKIRYEVQYKKFKEWCVQKSAKMLF